MIINKLYICFIIPSIILIIFTLPEKSPCTSNYYVGSDACKNCHPNEYKSFTLYAKKATSYKSIERAKKGLNDDELKSCYSCHTTGYGKPGGFISPEKTPHLKNAGCEVCHGPGALHIKTKNKAYIKRKLSMKDCETCHTSERIKAFRFKPLIHGGAH